MELSYMESYCIIGESDMKDFTPWWESHLPAYIIVYCLHGEAELKLQFRNHTFRQGMATIIPPDMFPVFTSRSETFLAFYCLMSRDFAEKSFFDMPSGFYDAIYVAPILPSKETMDRWITLLQGVGEDLTHPYRPNILSDLLHAFALDYYHRWKQYYGNQPMKDDKSPAGVLCMKFYNLIFDHFREQHTTAYYADRLCITPNYLAMITRQICNETPKQAIDRMIVLEMKYMLRNTSLTAEQIALHLHFPDTSYMCRFFRKQTGYSLSEYRKNDVKQ